MLEYLLDFVKDFGVYGLFIAMFLEGVSLPFPGLIIILTVGCVLKPGLHEITWLAVGMGLAYSLASYIPFVLGQKLGSKGGSNCLINKIYSKADMFYRFGEFSVCITRPFSVGNYISYIAGIGKMNPLRYGMLTFAGIFPWAFLMLFISTIHNYKSLSTEILFSDRYIFLFGVVLIFFIGIGYFTLRSGNRQNTS